MILVQVVRYRKQRGFSGDVPYYQTVLTTADPHKANRFELAYEMLGNLVRQVVKK